MWTVRNPAGMVEGRCRDMEVNREALGKKGQALRRTSVQETGSGSTVPSPRHVCTEEEERTEWVDLANRREAPLLIDPFREDPLLRCTERIPAFQTLCIPAFFQTHPKWTVRNFTAESL